MDYIEGRPFKTKPGDFISTFQNPFLAARNRLLGRAEDHLSLVIVTYLPVFNGPYSLLFLEADVPAFVEQTKNIAPFNYVIEELGLEKVQIVVASCLNEGYWTSKESLERTLRGLRK